MHQCLPAKTPTEGKTVTFAFANVASGTVSSPSIAKSVIVGTDPAAAGLTIGSPTISGTNILAMVSAGLNNVTYGLLCTVSDPAGQTHQDGVTLTTTTDAA